MSVQVSEQDDFVSEIDQLHREGYVLRCRVLHSQPTPFDYGTAITALAASNKVICIGCQHGKVYVLSFSGQVIAEIECHSARVNDLFHCDKGMMVSCADDGIIGVFDTTWETGKTHEFPGEKIKWIAVGPDPVNDFNLILSTDKSMLSNCYTVPYIGILWRDYIKNVPGHFTLFGKRRGDFLALATSAGFFVYDLKNKCVRIGIEPPEAIRSSNAIVESWCSVFWEEDSEMIVSWRNTVSIIKINDLDFKQDGKFEVEDDIILGAFPHRKDLILMFVKSEDKGVPVSAVVCNRSGKVLSRLSVPFGGSETTFKPKAYRFSRPLYTDNRTTMFMSSPANVFRIEFFDIDDSFENCKSKGRWDHALELVDRMADRITTKYSISDLQEKHIMHLFRTDLLQEAKDFMKSCCKDDAAWIQFFEYFKRANQVWTLYDTVPIENPTLPEEVYTLILMELFSMNPRQFRETLKSWPASIYDRNILMRVISTNKPTRTSSPSASGRKSSPLTPK